MPTCNTDYLPIGCHISFGLAMLLKLEEEEENETVEMDRNRLDLRVHNLDK